MKVIIDYLDDYLTQTGRMSLNPVEANVILSKAEILPNSKDRPGKPLRDLLRKGKLPHAFQSGGKGSSWIIPHSNKRILKTVTTKQIETKAKNQDKLIKTNKNATTTDISQLEKILLSENNFRSAGSIDNLVPHNCGLYCIRINDISKLPEPFNSFLVDRQHNIIYIGIAKKSLKQRLLHQELRANGHGTFFRSVGAVLGHRPRKGSLATKKNKRNYKFSSADEQKIIKWINENLKINWIEYSGDFESIETELILKYKPLINLSKNPFALKELLDLRKLCVQIANEQ